ncbi:MULTISPECIES: glycosyltransferase family 2 protein [unclassified Nitratiruptor]|uniref:glycosyltransferase family 2 protein n=1 Tax=unclassified Nitratiruptor TaxID=2624044 RepID=UPI001915B13C|nr:MULTISPECIES: glycosyltransferase family 2 protein [unclassified Nitratiruptor]
MKREVAIVIPLYNEEKVIRKTLQNLKNKRPNDTIIVVDDGSKDRSYYEACVPGVYLLRHIINLGQGAALQTGIDFAKKLGCKYVVTFDSDGQHCAEDIEKFIEVLRKDEADIVLCSRFLGKAENIPPLRKNFLRIAALVERVLTGIKLTDVHNGFRAINIAKFPDFVITQNRMSHASEIIDLIKKLKMRYKEIPCTIRYSEYSLSKGQSILNSVNIIIEFILGKAIK